jgi:hypothetical protein
MPQAPNMVDEPFIIVITGAKHTHVRDEQQFYRCDVQLTLPSLQIPFAAHISLHPPQHCCSGLTPCFILRRVVLFTKANLDVISMHTDTKSTYQKTCEIGKENTTTQLLPNVLRSTTTQPFDPPNVCLDTSQATTNTQASTRN